MQNWVKLATGVVVLLTAALTVDAGIPKVPKSNQNQTGDQGPYGLPSYKKVTDACMLTHDQEEALIRVYNDYKHKEHEEMQAKEKSASSSKSDCVNAVKQLLTPDQQKKFDELLGDSSGKKKKKT